jgi:hypothetical protein
MQAETGFHVSRWAGPSHWRRAVHIGDLVPDLRIRQVEIKVVVGRQRAAVRGGFTNYVAMGPNHVASLSTRTRDNTIFLLAEITFS